MSDIFQGPGWWLASDGKWYPPELHYDDAYRAAFADIGNLPAEQDVTADQDVTTEQHATAEQQIAETAEMSEIDLRDALDEVEHLRNQSPPQAPVPAAQAGTETIDLRELRDWPPTPDEAPNFSVATTPLSKAPERPVFEGTRAPSVVQAPAPPPNVGRLKVEVGNPIDAEVSPSDTPVIALSTSTDIEPFQPFKVSRFGYVTPRQRVVALLLFLSGVAMIVGAFLNWTVGAVVETGWARGDGAVAILAGVAGAAAAGPIALGLRHSFPKGVAIVGGAIGLMVAGLVVVNGVLSETARGVRVGPGLIVVIAASIAMIGSGIVDQGDEYG